MKIPKGSHYVRVPIAIGRPNETQDQPPLAKASVNCNGRVFPINPMTLARYREAFTPSRAKDDPTDADFLCELVELHREQLKAWQPDNVCTRKLRHLTLSRSRSVNMRTPLSAVMIARSLAPLPSIPTPFSLPLYLVAAQHSPPRSAT